MSGDGGCGSYNSTDTLYTIENLGNGEGIYSSSIIIPGETTFQLKSLVAGNNIILTSDADEITISADDALQTLTNIGVGAQIVASQSGTNANIRSITAGANTTVTQNANNISISVTNMLQTLTNLGTGAQIVSSQTATNANIRSVVAGTDIVVTQNANDITITSTFVPFNTEPTTIFYNYMNPVNVTYNTYYTGPGTITATFNTLEPITEGVLSVISPTTFGFVPAPRCAKPVIVLLRLTSTTGAYQTLVIKLVPNLTFANDTTLDLLLGSGANSIIYRINNSTGTITPLLNYDGTSVSTIIGALTTAIAMNQMDNILFYVLSASPTIIRYYDFVTKLTAIVDDVAGTDGWTLGAIITSMTFDQTLGVLYILGDLNTSNIRLLSIAPFDRTVGLVISSARDYPSVFPSAVGSVQQSLAINRANKGISGVVKPSIGDTQLRSTNIIGGVANNIATATITGDLVGHCEFAPSGRVYFIGDTVLLMRRTSPGRNTSNTFNSVFTSAVAFNDLTVSPFGL